MYKVKVNYKKSIVARKIYQGTVTKYLYQKIIRQITTVELMQNTKPNHRNTIQHNALLTDNHLSGSTNHNVLS